MLYCNLVYVRYLVTLFCSSNNLLFIVRLADLSSLESEMTTMKLEGGEERMEVEEKRGEEKEEKREEEKREEEEEKEGKAREGRVSPAQLRDLMGDVLNTLGRPLHPYVKTKISSYFSLLSF